MTWDDTWGFVSGVAAREGVKWAHRGAVLLCEYRAARAESDGVSDWQDLFWPRQLKRLDVARFERLEEKRHDGAHR